jgi:hypothetical protein
MSTSPYKLFDYYTYEDRHLFFGREEEPLRMVGEILSSRLLVLFAPSGSGKSSLINAGVRPRLEDRGFRTIYVRMETDPATAIRQSLGGENGTGSDHDDRCLSHFPGPVFQRNRGRCLILRRVRCKSGGWPCQAAPLPVGRYAEKGI